MVSGVLFMAFPFLLVVPLIFLLSAASGVVAVLLMPVAMAGFHVLQRQSYGRIGLAGFWLTVIASLIVAWGVADFFVFGDMLQDAPPPTLTWGTVGLLVGFVLYGVATLQARVLPRWCGVAFIVALPATLALIVIGPLPLGFAFILLGLVWLALGYMLWRRSGTVSERPSRVR